MRVNWNREENLKTKFEMRSDLISDQVYDLTFMEDRTDLQLQ